MAPVGLARLPFILAIVLVYSSVGHAFKAHDFKTCDEASFCKRHRDKEPGVSTYKLNGDLVLNGPELRGTVTSAAGVDLYLVITSYDDGVFRVKLNEDPSKNRYEVSDVLEHDLEARRVPFASVTGAKDQHGNPTTVVVSKHGDSKLLVTHSPLSISLLSGSSPCITLNRRGLLDFEHTREKGSDSGEAGLWEENFKGHRDSKPRGPNAIAFDASFDGARQLYGIPERATSMALKPTKGPGISSEPYRLYNLDVFEYLDESPFGLYGSIPFMLAHGERSTCGLFWLNAAEMFVDVLAPATGAATSPAPPRETMWIAESGVMDLFLLPGPRPAPLMAQFGRITGTSALPPSFAIGYHQCRWNYKNEADVFHVDEGFDSHDIPYDVIWLDIEHTDGKRYLTWDSRHFPRPAELQEAIAAKGRKTVAIVDPHVKRDSNYGLHKEAESKGYYVKDRDGKDFDGWCWPGSSSYLDMVSPVIRSWWADKFSLEAYAGSTRHLHIWNDMNEPSVFNGPEITMPKDNLHAGGVEHRDVHNAFGYYYHMASADGLLRRSGGTERPFVLSRAVFSGTQRVGPVWTGDNTADWKHLRVSIPMVITLGLAGVAFNGADVGGFFGNPEPELLVRWYQLGAFYPFFRGHAHLDTRRREPWLFGEESTALIRDAIRTRYSLLPYVYTLFRAANTSGLPVMRPLWMHYPEDAAAFSLDDQFLLGEDLLLAPVLAKGATSRHITFPAPPGSTCRWYDMTSGEFVVAPTEVNRPVNMGTVPAYYRGGAVVARRERPRRNSKSMAEDPYTLVVALDSAGAARGELYLDDGSSYAFRQAGGFLHREFVMGKGVLTARAHAEEAARGGGKYTTPCVVERIVILGAKLPAGADAGSTVRVTKKDASGRVAMLQASVGAPMLLSPSAQKHGVGRVANGGSGLALVVRKPELNIGGEWSLHFEGI
eukprot:jgi/Mesvir1/24960/Mv16930-RA.1